MRGNFNKLDLRFWIKPHKYYSYSIKDKHLINVSLIIYTYKVKLIDHIISLTTLFNGPAKSWTQPVSLGGQVIRHLYLTVTNPYRPHQTNDYLRNSEDAT